MYDFEKYRGRITSKHDCPACGGKFCFSYYVNEDGIPLDATVGRCDHEIHCGYHYTPRDWFRDHKLSPTTDWKTQVKQVERRRLCTIDQQQVSRFRSNASTLFQFLCTRFSEEDVGKVAEKYLLGALSNGNVIFWQIDSHARVRTGKVMAYGEDGHRIKGEVDRITWMHTLLIKDGMLQKDFELTQCFFGEHLVNIYPNAPIFIVESEKTAIICSLFLQDYVWIATGGKNGLNASKMAPLKGREIYVMPDADAMDEWSAKIEPMKEFYNIQIHPDINYTPEQIDAHADWADILLQEK